MLHPLLSSSCVFLFLLNSLDGSVEAATGLATLEVNNEGATTPASVENVTEKRMPEQAYETEEEETEEEASALSSSDGKPMTAAENLPLQTGPLIDIFGQQLLLSLEMVDENSAELRPHFTSDALRGKKVIGVYFSADWCGPCRKFTPELVRFYNKVNKRRGKKDEFEIVWVSRCRDVKSYGQYFTQMGGWVALPPEEAMGERGARLSEKYKVKGIPTLILLDDLGEVITLDGRNKIPQDKAGIGFPWRNPLATLYMMMIPRSLRLMVRSQVESVREIFVARVKQVVGLNKKAKASKLDT